MSDLPHLTSRRTILAAGAVGTAGLVLGPVTRVLADASVDDTVGDVGGSDSLDTSDAACGATLITRSEIWNQPTWYDDASPAAASFSYNATFYSRLETWLAFWYANTPASWLTPLRVYSLGAYSNRNDGCVSMHNYGRAFDLTRVYATINGTLGRGMSARYNIWRTWTGADLTKIRKSYWGTAASLHYHFRHVLTYPYNTDHWSHIHIDNQVSGSGNSTFSTASRAQVLHVQACLTYIWGYSTTIDGIWGPQTSGNASKALVRIGRSGSLTSSQTNWLEFNKATLRFGTGTQSY
jgi:hypothetical protein